MVEVAAWQNFEHLEDSLTLDELLLLNEALGKKFKDQFKLLAMSQGHDVDSLDDDEPMIDRGNESELPAELLEAERAAKAKRIERAKQTGDGLTELGFGYIRT